MKTCKVCQDKNDKILENIPFENDRLYSVAKSLGWLEETSFCLRINYAGNIYHQCLNCKTIYKDTKEVSNLSFTTI